MKRPLIRLFVAPLAARPGRALLSVLAIGFGVALGVAVGSIHTSALEEFSRGIRTVAGSADLQVSGGREGFDESLYPTLARHPDVAWASPVVEVRAAPPGPPRTTPALPLLGLDAFRAWRVAAALQPRRQETGQEDNPLALFADDAISLSPAAAQWLGKQPGDALELLSGTRALSFRVAALIPGAGAGQRLAVADIATVQARFGMLGRLTRIDLVLAPGVPRTAAQEHLAALLPAGVTVQPVAVAELRAERLSRAYRINLSLLALMALATGAFLVFSSQAAVIVRRRGEFAFLRALGMTRRELMAGILAEAALVGALGSLFGTALGVALAWGAIDVLGGDLGAGYFAGAAPRLTLDPWWLAGYAILGVLMALAGAWLPAREAAATPPALALKAGDDERALARQDHGRIALACILTGTAALGLPTIGGLPPGAYLAIALWLVGAVLMLPRLARIVFARLPTAGMPAARLAAAQVKGTPGLAALGASGVLAATAVAAAMAIMIGSFRDSVDRWLVAMLPADLYLRASVGSASGFLDPDSQAAIAATPGVARADFTRFGSAVLDPTLPAVAVLARPLATAPQAMALGATVPLPADVRPLWASEAMADLYHWHAGQTVRLPLAGREQAFTVAGFWRDYTRSFGAVVIDLDVYRGLTGDLVANDAALQLEPGAAREAVTAALRQRLPDGERVDIADAGGIRALSLRMFDRTFAVTYALQAAAVLIGLAGVAASFAALAEGRRREFGMLAHIGLTRRELAAAVAGEGAAVAALGVAVGLLLAFAIGAVLVFIVNPRSFHWTMDYRVPWASLAAFAVLMVAGAAAAAVLAARRAFGAEAVRAVRDDW